MSSVQHFKSQSNAKQEKINMEDVTNVRFVPLNKSPYCSPLRFLYTQDGTDKTWDLITVYDRVSTIVFNVTRMVFLLVKQFRPAMYYNSILPDDREGAIDTKKYPMSLGFTLELCSGLISKNKSPKHMAIQKVLDECGYEVPQHKMNRIMTSRTGIGEQAATMTFYFCEVTDDMKTDSGDDADEETIEVIEKTIPEIEEFVNSPGPLASPPGLLFCIVWFLHNKAPAYKAMSAIAFQSNVQL